VKPPPLTKQRHQCELVPLPIKSFINKNTALKECRAGANPAVTICVVNRRFDLNIRGNKQLASREIVASEMRWQEASRQRVRVSSTHTSHSF
jgi:hypothetical protein